MKTSKLIAVILIGMMGMQKLNAQDTLVTKNESMLSVRITDETSSEIYFERWQQEDNTVYKIEKKDLKRVYYMNGDKEMLNYDDSEVINKMTAGEISALAKSDARKYFNKNRGAGTATLLTTIFLTPAGGLITAAACASTPPDMNKINLRSALLESDPNYTSSFMQAARKIKQQKVWKNFAIGFAIDAAVFGLVALAASNMDMNMNMTGGSGSGGNFFTIRSSR